MYKTFEEVAKGFEEQGYRVVRGSQATQADREDINTVIIQWA